MNYQKKYELQKKINADILQKNEELEHEIERLKQDNTFIKNYDTKSGDEAKVLIAEITTLRDELYQQYEELREIKAKYTEAYHQALALKKEYTKRFQKFQKSLPKQK